jgi:hypothetical protein
MSDIRISHNSDGLSGQEFHTAHGVDKHGGYHDYNDVDASKAERGCQEEIDEANEDD